jgi:hypothetical protein
MEIEPEKSYNWGEYLLILYKTPVTIHAITCSLVEIYSTNNNLAEERKKTN